MRTTHPIARLVQTLFQQYRTGQRGLGQHTVLAYRDCIKLFLRFSQERVGKPVDKLVREDFDEKLITSFLNTTHGYVEIDMKMKRRALATCRPPGIKGPWKKEAVRIYCRIPQPFHDMTHQ